MNRVWTLAMKDLRLLWRDKMGLFWVLGFPILYALLFGAIMGGGGERGSGGIKIAVVDRDKSAFAGQFLTKLKANPGLRVADPAPAFEEGLDQVRRGDLVAMLVLEPGLGDGMGFFGGGEPKIQLAIDPARTAEAGYLQGMIAQSVFESLQNRFMDRDETRKMIAGAKGDIAKAGDLDPAQKLVFSGFMESLDLFIRTVDPEIYEEGLGGAGTKSPGGGGMGFDVGKIEVTKDETGQPRSIYNITFPSAILWGLLGCVSAFAISLVTERTGGTLQRLLISPMGFAEILAGKGLACFLACVGTTVVLLTIGVLGPGVRVSSFPLLALAIVCTALCFVGVMMFVSVLGKTEASVSGAGWAIFIVWAMLGGGMIPLYMMPPFMQTLSHFSPVKWGVLALEGAIWRDFTPKEMALPCGVLVGVGLVFFAVGYGIFHRRSN
ncbi:ABC transporter permease [Candidatus Poribacteria bacterium]|nr:ABC transporter permease [Candidatus Poribacteria bacterium]